MSESLFLILGNQLFPESYLPSAKSLHVFMAEDAGLCTHFRYHKHKLILFLAAMRAYAEELRARGAKVEYVELDEQTAEQSYEEKLHAHVQQSGVKKIVVFEIEDKFFEERIIAFCKTHKLDLEVLNTPMFLTPREELADRLRRKPFMKTFYEWQRRRLDLLMTDDGKPLGGQFSFDPENRKALPKSVYPPALPKVNPSKHVKAVAKVIDDRFADHPGDSSNFWLPVTRRGALRWMQDFFEYRFHEFGPYEDAIPTRSPFVFHSVLSPLINLGLLTPAEVIAKAIEYAGKEKVPLPSLEGFVRQIVGWREFIRGIYQSYSEVEEKRNFWKARGKLSEAWYTGQTGVPPLDAAIQKVLRFGWCHHIERLMVISNLMLLSGIDPKEGHRWFMEMFVDSSDWVMGPNVYGMGLFSDGEVFATKPYICGSNYYLKMGDFSKGEWCNEVDGLYWGFIEKHRAYFEKNLRTQFIPKNLDRLSADRKKVIYRAGERLKARLVE